MLDFYEKGKLVFFTDAQTECSKYCLTNIKYYNRQKLSKKKIIFIDPAVYQLKKSNEYLKIKELHKKVKNLYTNEFISIDYPSDMNSELENLFILKTNYNNFKYASNNQYICTIQSKFKNIASFKENFELLKPLFRNKIVGIGNLCRIIYPKGYSEKLVKYLIKNKSYLKYLHLYGVSLRFIRKHIKVLTDNFCVSVDSTKWTRACNTSLKKKYGLNCNSNTRNIFFKEYMKTIEEGIGIPVKY